MLHHCPIAILLPLTHLLTRSLTPTGCEQVEAVNYSVPEVPDSVIVEYPQAKRAQAQVRLANGDVIFASQVVMAVPLG